MVPFDTLKLACDLCNRGKLTAAQAEGVAASLVDATRDNVATTSDFQEFRTDLIARMDWMDACLNKRIDELDLRLSNRIDALGKDLTIRLGGVLVVAVGAMAALVKLL
ncbi:MAG: hypothetical protein ACK5YI_12260 [Rhodospirillales bacterium]|jgi:hypothetical protein